VDELFARIKADRAGAVAAAMPAASEAELEPAVEAEASPDAQPPGAPQPHAETAHLGAPADVEVGVDPDRSEGAEFVDERPPLRSVGGRAVSDETARGRRDELLEPIEDTLTRQLKRVLQDEQNEVLDRLRRKRRRRSGPALRDAEEQIGRFREVAESILGDAVRAGVRFASPAASEAHADEGAARDAADALAREISEPLRQRLERCFVEGDEGAGGDDRDGDGAELSERVSSVYRQWRANEVERVARHHAATAFGLGAYAGYAEGTALVWVVDDESPCPDCDDNALAGAVVKGEAYPTGQVHPPAHPGCRCILVPTVP
jgi:hypothetical protein